MPVVKPQNFRPANGGFQKDAQGIRGIRTARGGIHSGGPEQSGLSGAGQTAKFSSASFAGARQGRQGASIGRRAKAAIIRSTRKIPTAPLGPLRHSVRLLSDGRLRAAFDSAAHGRRRDPFSAAGAESDGMGDFKGAGHGDLPFAKKSLPLFYVNWYGEKCRILRQWWIFAAVSYIMEKRSVRQRRGQPKHRGGWVMRGKGRALLKIVFAALLIGAAAVQVC